MINLKKNITFIVLFTLIIMLMITGCSQDIENISQDNNIEEQSEDIKSEVLEAVTKQDSSSNQEMIVEGNLEVHFIDIGQGDSIFIKQDDFNMLVDAGDNSYGNQVVEYLKERNVSKLDYVIGTHPHSDHIGGLDNVINTFKVEKIIMPKVTHTTKTFEDVIMAIKAQNLKITTPKAGDTYILGDASYTILGPSSSEYNNLNDYSVIIKLDYGKISFMFTGDAEEVAEREVIDLKMDIKSNVLKAGHHGSDTSTIDVFLEKVLPNHVVIQVGEGNKYDHPDADLLNKLEEKGINVYRNDLHGTIKIISDGTNIYIETEKMNNNSNDLTNTSATGSQNNIEENKYIGNTNSKVFHKEDCNSLPAEHNRVYLTNKDKAISEGFRACGRCNP